MTLPRAPARRPGRPRRGRGHRHRGQPGPSPGGAARDGKQHRCRRPRGAATGDPRGRRAGRLGSRAGRRLGGGRRTTPPGPLRRRVGRRAPRPGDAACLAGPRPPDPEPGHPGARSGRGQPHARSLGAPGHRPDRRRQRCRPRRSGSRCPATRPPRRPSPCAGWRGVARRLGADCSKPERERSRPRQARRKRGHGGRGPLGGFETVAARPPQPPGDGESPARSTATTSRSRNSNPASSSAAGRRFIERSSSAAMGPAPARRMGAGTPRSALRRSAEASASVNSAFVGVRGQHKLNGPSAVGDSMRNVAAATRSRWETIGKYWRPLLKPSSQAQPEHRAQDPHRCAALAHHWCRAHDAHPCPGLARRRGGGLPLSGDVCQQLLTTQL